jgi:hypothetical protein
MNTFLRTALIILIGATAHAAVVRPAPNFGLEGTPRASSLKSFRGQSVVLVFTRSARGRAFREMVRRLRGIYGQFATEKVLFVAAITEGPQDVPSDIPFVLASNPAQVASDYGITGKFGIAVIGIDGNLDLITEKMIAAARVKDAISNNYETQSAARKPFAM